MRTNTYNPATLTVTVEPIRAEANRKAPRGYEDRLRKYFEAID